MIKNKVRLYFDEDVHPDLVYVLQEKGFDAITTIEAGLQGNSDRQQIDYAISNNRAILTFNVKHFVLLYNEMYSKNRQHPGIVVSTQQNFGETLKRLLKLLNNKTAEEMSNSIEFLNNWK